MLKTYDYHSALAPYIKGLIDNKRALGFKYEFEGYILKQLDEYWIMQGFSDCNITRNKLEGWMKRKDTEGKTYHNQRISFTRVLCIYLNSIGILAYVPGQEGSTEHRVPHVLSHEEVIAFFQSLDELSTGTKPERVMMKYEYQIMFRLIYSCGLRVSEACNLQTAHLDLEANKIWIMNGKGQKDRIVYLQDDLSKLCKQYHHKLKEYLSFEPVWFFPSSDYAKPIHKTTVANKFNVIWNKTSFSKTCDKKPTTHSLRHTMIVRRLNRWMEEGVNLEVMLPYLSKFVGHNGPDETFYYFHLVHEAFKHIHEKDTKGKIIPEVLI